MQPDGVNAHIVEADVTDQAALHRAAETAKALLDGAGIDVVILNAAYVSDRTALKSLQDLSVTLGILPLGQTNPDCSENDAQPALDDMQKSIDVNVLGVLKTVTAFLPLVQQGALKKVIAVSSGMGDIDFINETKLPIAAPYAVSKAALNALMAKFAAAYADQGILFASICPGRVDTAEPGASRKCPDQPPHL